MNTTLSLLLANHHNESFGLGNNGPIRDASGASALLMVALVALLCTAILVFALNLRRRSLNPSPESLLLDEVRENREFHEANHASEDHHLGNSPRSDWEKPDDWWKSPRSGT